MLLVSGATTTIRPEILAKPNVFGTLVQPRDKNALPEFGKWAADNDALNGFDAEAFEKMLGRHAYARGRCLFVAAPDVVSKTVSRLRGHSKSFVSIKGNHSATLELFREWEPRLHAANWPVAFVLQDGCKRDDVPWHHIEAVFIGGSDEYKLGADAAHICATAATKGKWIHMGRVNGPGRIQYAAVLGCHSVDGSGYSKYAIEMLHRRGHAGIFRDLAEQRWMFIPFDKITE